MTDLPEREGSGGEDRDGTAAGALVLPAATPIHHASLGTSEQHHATLTVGAARNCALQLNLYHVGRSTTSKCPLVAGCRRREETVAHIFWECNRARVAWGKLLGLCTKYRMAADSAKERCKRRKQASH
ncbi:hypothetical protein PybrP1_008567 [[Pythium] brassicae (nom. inval.)]|nr:hypothetical protein PybrP1_008567 [[Pythium] brassicae (nom. inval.)]